ncbi:MAG: hypothetical protein ACRDRU_05375 [Pseudonocardiaceae bacterium]
MAAGTESGAAVVFIAFPPVQGPAALVRTLGAAGALRLARFLTLPARRMDHELFRGESGRLLLAGDAPHADAPVSGVYGWLLAILGQDVGFPVPVGGAGELAAALARCAEAAGAQLCTRQRVECIDVAGNRPAGRRGDETLRAGLRCPGAAADRAAPGDVQRTHANLVHGAVHGGTAQLHQQLVFRPVPGLERAETPVPGLYLGSAAAHPDGGVHGVCGWLTARAALVDHRALGGLRRRPPRRQ